MDDNGGVGGSDRVGLSSFFSTGWNSLSSNQSFGVSSMASPVDMETYHMISHDNIRFQSGSIDVTASPSRKRKRKLQERESATKIEVNDHKENYVHVRARRGQATNSHSLAERVRREKISERMRMLQELVPGCSKITGKAVMLDEIINYVQSLQQQVEFLSMKLATVDPNVNIDIDHRHHHGHPYVTHEPFSAIGSDAQFHPYPRLVNSQLLDQSGNPFYDSNPSGV